MLTIPKSCERLMGLQVTQYPGDRDAPERMMVADRNLYRPFLPELPANVLDLGCGLGRATVGLHQHYQASIVRYHLVDGDLESPSQDGGWEPKEQEWCCNFRWTYEFLDANCLRLGRYSFHDLASPHDCFEDIPPIDLMISTLAVGFHWPIEPWLPRLKKVCRQGATLIFGVRSGKYTEGQAFPDFEFKGFAESGWKQDFLALRCTSSTIPSRTSWRQTPKSD